MQSLILSALFFAASASAAATTVFPAAVGTPTTFASAPHTIAAGQTFDGKMARFGRGIPCDTDEDGGSNGAVFILAEGATLKNAIIGPDQLEGVHCNGQCTIQNVWWEDVCEDALTLLQPSGNSYIIGGGARNAVDKIIQHNGKGTVHITDFFADTYGKIYRGCGNCSGNGGPRKVIVKGVVAKGGKPIAGVNANYGDTATISGSCGVKLTSMCEPYTGCDKAKNPGCDAVKGTPGFNGVSCIDGGNNKATC